MRYIGLTLFYMGIYYLNINFVEYSWLFLMLLLIYSLLIGWSEGYGYRNDDFNALNAEIHYLRNKRNDELDRIKKLCDELLGERP